MWEKQSMNLKRAIAHRRSENNGEENKKNIC
jgi:hypothetical protein